MAWSAGSSRHGSQTSAPTASWSIIGSASTTVGDVYVMVVASNNFATTDTQSNDHVSVTGNSTWVKIGEFTNGNGAANAGVTVSAWYCIITSTTGLDGTTINFSADPGKAVYQAKNFTPANGFGAVVGTLQTSAVDSGTGLASMTVSGLGSNSHLYVRATGLETNSDVQGTPTSTYAWVGENTAGDNSTTGGSAASNIAAGWEWLISTSSSSTSSLSWLTVDSASIMFALDEAGTSAVGRYAQAQTQIKQTYTGYAQAQADTKSTNRNYGQAQAQIKIVGVAYGQANAQTKGVVRGYAQVQADLKATSTNYSTPYAQVIANIKNSSTVFSTPYAQAQADIKATNRAYAQAQTSIRGTVFAQANADIKAAGRGYAQAQTDIKAVTTAYAQANSNIKATLRSYAQALGTIIQVGRGYSQAQADIKAPSWVFAQGNANIKAANRGYAQAHSAIKTIYFVYAQSQTSIKGNKFGQAQGNIKSAYQAYSQAQSSIKSANFGFAQGHSSIKSIYQGYSQAQASIVINLITIISTAQAQSTIKQSIQNVGQAQASILTITQGFGQSNTSIKIVTTGYAQAQTSIRGFKVAQAQASILARNYAFAQALATMPGAGIPSTGFTGQLGISLSSLGNIVLGTLGTSGTRAYAQASAKITNVINFAYSNAKALIQPRNGLVSGMWSGGQTNEGAVGSWATLNAYNQPNYSNNNPPPGALGGEYWGMMWAGSFIADVTGPWTFISSTDDGSSLLISGPAIVGTSVTGSFSISGTVATLNNNWGGGQSETYRDGTVTLIAGQLYTIQAKVGNGPGNYTFRFLYARPGEGSYYLTSNNPPWISVPPYGYRAANAGAKIIAFGVRAGGQTQAFISKSAGYGQALATIFSRPYYSGQAQAKVVYKRWAFGQAQTAVNSMVFAQAQASITRKEGYAQAQTYLTNAFGWQSGQVHTSILHFTDELGTANSFGSNITPAIGWQLAPYGTGLAQAHIFARPRRVAQATADIKNVSTNFSTPFAQAQAVIGHVKVSQIAMEVLFTDPTPSVRTSQIAIEVLYRRSPVPNSGQAMAFVLGSWSMRFGHAQAFMNLHLRAGQAQAYIRLHYVFGQANADIEKIQYKNAQAQASIWRNWHFGQALAEIKGKSRGYGQALAFIGKGKKYAQAQAYIMPGISWKYGQTQTSIRVFTGNYGQSQAYIGHIRVSQIAIEILHHSATPNVRTSQIAIEVIFTTQHGWGKGQARAVIVSKIHALSANVQAQIENTYFPNAQAQAAIRGWMYGQAQAWIHSHVGHAQAISWIFPGRMWAFGQALAFINNKAFANARAHIKQKYLGTGQASVIIYNRHFPHGQAQASIRIGYLAFGQAQAFFGHFQFAQAQARIVSYGVPRYANSQAYILVNINIPPVGPSSDRQSYLVRYNNYDLPGYAQEESIESVMRRNDAFAAYLDSGLSEYIGLGNKTISIRMKTWESTYLLNKTKVQKAATMLRSSKNFASLYIQRYDAHLLAMVKNIQMQKSISETMRTIDYAVTFEAKPWLISNTTHTISGTGTISTSQVGRTLSNGGWTPTIITLDGTNITVSGYTIGGDFTGYITTSGSVSGLVIDSEAFTATQGGANKNSIMNKDYHLYVGPGETLFDITGATSCTISYNDRWYL